MVTVKNMEKSVQNIKNDSITDYYEAFIGKYTSGTSKAYKTALNLMSNFFYGKDMKFLTVSELEDLKMIDIMRLNEWLNESVEGEDGVMNKRYKVSTINKHVNGMKSFFRFLSKEFDSISDKIFRNIDLASPKKDSESYGGLDWDEAKSLWEYAQDNFGEKSDKLSMLIRLASVTSIRGEALTSATWSKSWKTKKERGVIINYIDVIDKGKRHIKPVSENFYNELREKLPEDKMFNGLNRNNINNLLQKCLDALGFDSNRNIKFHSLKNAGVMRALDLTDNIYKAQEQGNHSSIATSEKFYLKYKESLMDMVSYSIEEVVDSKSELEEFTKDELISAISKMREVSQRELLQILKG